MKCSAHGPGVLHPTTDVVAAVVMAVMGAVATGEGERRRYLEVQWKNNVRGGASFILGGAHTTWHRSVCGFHAANGSTTVPRTWHERMNDSRAAVAVGASAPESVEGTARRARSE